MKASEWIEERKQHLFSQAAAAGKHDGYHTANPDWYKERALLDYLDTMPFAGYAKHPEEE